MKTDVDLAWEDSRDQARVTIRRVVRRLEHAVMADLGRRFDQAVIAGRVDEFTLDETSVASALRRYALALPEAKDKRVSRRS